MSTTLSKPLSCAENGRKKRRPAGTPDPDAQVVILSPKTLLESDRYVCEICNQAFQRDQNLQMHRRRHKVPWKLIKRDSTPSAARKRVFVCPEPNCIHHDPSHALGDLVGIKKHFRRKHSNHKQWVCGKCNKGYAVQSDYKAHIKTCGTRGHSCDCGRVFSRVESFIEHQDSCSRGPLRSDSLSLAASTRSPSSLPKPSMDNYHDPYNYLMRSNNISPNLELQLLTKTTTTTGRVGFSINASSSGTGDRSYGAEDMMSWRNPMINIDAGPICGEAEEHKRIMAEKSYAEELRHQAEEEFANAKRIRRQAQAELEKAQALKHHAAMQMHSTIMQITCHSCHHKFQRAFGETFPSSSSYSGENALGLSYISAALKEWGINSKCDHQN